MREFTRFASNFLDYANAVRHGITEDTGPSGPMFVENIRQSLLKCHIFETTTDMKRLLSMTTCPNKNDQFKLPFPVMFIDVSFKKDEMQKLGIDIGYDEIIGIMVSEAYLFTEEEQRRMDREIRLGVFDRSIVDKYDKDDFNKVGSGLRITICSLHQPGEYGRIWFDTFNVNINVFDEYKDYNLKIKKVDSTDPKARKFIHLFTLNFINFLHDTRVKIVTVDEDKKRNAKRIKKGKVPIPKRKIIKLTGDLKIYTDNLKKDRKTWEYSHSWWVRGHYRVLRDPEYWGKKAGTRIFIPPHIKGKGVLVEKTYEVDKSNKLDGMET